MAVKKNTDLILVRPVHRINKVALTRDIVLTAVLAFFMFIIYISHFQLLAFYFVEMVVILFVVLSWMLKVFAGESFAHMVYFNYVRKKKWK